MQKTSFSTRLSLYFTCAISCIFLCIFAYSYLQTEQTIRKISLERASTLALAATEKIEHVLQEIEQVPLYIAERLATEEASGEFGLEQVEKTLAAFVSSQPDVYGASISFAYGALPNAPMRYAPYYFKEDGELRQSSLANDAYEYWMQDWYVLPQKTGKAQWSEPYFDKGGGDTLMATFSVPVYKKDAAGKEQFFAMVTADISLKWLQQIVDTIQVYNTGRAFILSRNGVFMTHQNSDFILQHGNTIYEVAKNRNLPKLWDLAHKMTSGQKGTASFERVATGQDMEVLYHPLPTSGWSLALFVPMEELLAELNKQTVIMVVFAIIGIVLTALLVAMVSYGATKPLRQLSKSTREIAQGQLETELPKIRHFDEIGQLTQDFEQMRKDLKTYLDTLTAATAAKERIESELKIARSIQESFVPKKFPPFPERKEIDIFASLLPAREVGGDFYDFFIFDKDLLFFSVGDVSGKGMPAALFMAVVKTLVKSMAEHERDPAKILQFTNNKLVEDNDNCMFVTLFCGILHVRTGELVYANAGHDAPLVVSTAAPISPLAVPKSVALGIVEDVSYINKRIQLSPDDVLFLFTDGVTEAMSFVGEQFGLTRLYKSLESGSTATDLVNKVHEAVKEHEGDAEQSDDITIMALRWAPIVS